MLIILIDWEFLFKTVDLILIFSQLKIKSTKITTIIINDQK
jgi:hypothetical protein